jgi:hypothetical protein
MESRIVKIPLPVDLIRRIDEALAEGRGGLETRANFIKEASENFLAELTYPDAPPEGGEPGGEVGRFVAIRKGDWGQRTSLPSDFLSSLPPSEQEELRVANLQDTVLPAPPEGVTLETGVAETGGQPLLGIHNRDYPSLWAAHRLARYTENELVSFSDFRIKVTTAAWFYAHQLSLLDDHPPATRLTALFPSNPLKRESAERAFQTFAVGAVPRRLPQKGRIKVDGPLFAWNVCQLQREEGQLMVGLTSIGRKLLVDLAGISLKVPHEESLTRTFLSHLLAHSPGERWGFGQIIQTAAGNPDREQLVSIISRVRDDWSSATASSVAQGYVARAREWGLLERRLVSGRYALTDLGKKLQGYGVGE